MYESCHEIIVVFVLYKLILQTGMHSRPVGLDVCFFGRTLRLLPYFMCANNKGSGKQRRPRIFTLVPLEEKYTLSRQGFLSKRTRLFGWRGNMMGGSVWSQFFSCFSMNCQRTKAKSLHVDSEDWIGADLYVGFVMPWLKWAMSWENLF